jgi:hypothetical protein
VLKYTLASLVIIVGMAAALFTAAAWWNERDAEAGPREVVSITVTGGGATPSRIEVKRGRLVELTITNDTNGPVRATSEAEGVEQFIAGDVLSGHSGESLSSVLMDVPQGATRSAPVRFGQRGEFELNVQAGDAGHVVHIVVR